MKNIRTSSGITLMELLVSIVIVSSALVAILSVYSTTMRLNLQNEARSRAKFYGEQEMERLLSLSYFSDELSAYGSFNGTTRLFEYKDYIIKTKVVYLDPTTGKVPEVYPFGEEEDPNLKEVTVSVIRKDGLGGQIDIINYKGP